MPEDHVLPPLYENLHILDLSRIEANKFELEVQPLDLAELIQDLSHTFTSQAQQKQLDFTICSYYGIIQFPIGKLFQYGYNH